MVYIMNIDIFLVNLCALKCIRPILLCSVYVESFFSFILLPYDMYLPHPPFSSLFSAGPQLCFSSTLIQCSFISIQKRTELTNFKNHHGIRWKKTRLKPLYQGSIRSPSTRKGDSKQEKQSETSPLPFFLRNSTKPTS